MNRFKMEDSLINLNKVNDDLKTIARQVVDGTLDRDDVFSALHGLAIIHEARFAEAWDVFLQTFKLEQYSNRDNNSNYSDDEPEKDNTVWY